jgi:hypothetical protein
MATDTMPRTPGTRQPPGRAPRPAPRDLRTRPLTAPRHTRPVPGPAAPAGPGTAPAGPGTAPAGPGTAPVTGPGTRRTAGHRPRPRQPRAPFILLLVGLLGGALVSLLVISTTLAQGSYKITSLQQQNTALAKQEQLLTEQVAQASSPAQIAREAELLGMQQNPNLRFIDLKTGKIVAGKVSAADAAISVPGYTP